MIQQLGSHTFEKDEIIEFASQFDPQRFHLSQEEAEQSNFGALCASGWHTASIWMRLNIQNGSGELARLVGNLDIRPVFGPSPGVRNLRWLRPVYVGDTITYRSTLTGKRKSPKRKGWGLILSHSEGFNQNGKPVISMDGAVTIKTD